MEILKSIYEGVRRVHADICAGAMSTCSPPRAARKTEFMLHSADICSSTKFAGLIPIIPPRIFARLCDMAASLQLPTRVQRVLDRLVYSFFALADPDRLIRGTEAPAFQDAMSMKQHYASHEPAVPSWMLLPALDVRRFVTHEIPATISLLSSFEYDITRLSPGLHVPVPGMSGASPCRGTDQARHECTPTRTFCSPSRRAVQAVSQAWLSPDPPHAHATSLEAVKLLMQYSEEGEDQWPQMRMWWPEFAEADFGHAHRRTTAILGPEAACSLVLRVLRDVILVDLQDADFLWGDQPSLAAVATVPTTLSTAVSRRAASKRRRGPWASMILNADATSTQIPSTIRARYRTLQFISLFFVEAHNDSNLDAHLHEPRRLSTSASTTAVNLVADLCYLLAAPGAGVGQSGLGFMAQHCELGHVPRWMKIITEPTLASLFPADVLSLYIERGLTPPSTLEEVCNKLNVDVLVVGAGLQRLSGSKRGRSAASAVALPAQRTSLVDGPDGVGASRRNDNHMASPPRQRRRPTSKEATQATTDLQSAALAGEVNIAQHTAVSSVSLLLPVDRVAGGELLEGPKRVGWGLARMLSADANPPAVPAPSAAVTEAAAPLRRFRLADKPSGDPVGVVPSPLKKRPVDRLARKAADGRVPSSKYGRPQPSVSLNSDKWIKKLGKHKTVFLRRAVVGGLIPGSKPG
jgi:hypothetical protein